MPPISRPISTAGSPSTNDDRRLAGLLERRVELDLERREQHERGEHGRADRVALRDGLRRVADRVERVGHGADLLGQVGHLGDAAGVVRDRAERVERDDQAGQRELRHDGDADAVDAGEVVRPEDAEREHERRGGGGLEALGEALDDVRRVARLGRLRGGLDRREARRRVVVGDHEQQSRDADADQRAEVEVADAGDVAGAPAPVQRDAVHQPLRDRVERRRGEHAGDDQALVEGALDVAGGRPHEEGADDRRDDRDAAEDERVERHLRRRVAERQHAEQHHGDGRDRVGLEQVGRHAGAVADVVADVVGDHGRVARVVLGDAGLDLADEVGADVGALREDAAAQTGEDGDQRAAEAEADQRVDGLLRGVVDPGGEDAVVAGDAEQREADDEHAGDRAAAERDAERLRDAVTSGLGDARVGAHRDVHADVAGRRRRAAADREADGDLDVLDEDQRHEQDDADDGDRRY